MPVDAGVQIAFGAAPSPSLTDLEAFSLRLTRAEWHVFENGTKPIPIPNSDTIEFSWPHVFVLGVNNSAPGVVITNRRFELTYLPSTLRLWYGVLPAYRQTVEANLPDPVASSGTPTPKGAGAPGAYLPLTYPGEQVMYDDTPVEALAGTNGAFIEVVYGVVGLTGQGSFINYPAFAMRMTWDER